MGNLNNIQNSLISNSSSDSTEYGKSTLNLIGGRGSPGFCRPIKSATEAACSWTESRRLQIKVLRE